MENGKILIAGTGRAGSSFLVQMTHLLGFRTGFKHIFDKWKFEKRGGLETEINSRPTHKLPYIIKDPTLSLRIGQMVEENFPIEHVIVPVRKLVDTANSRLQDKIWWDGDPAKHDEKGGMVPFLGYVLGQLTSDLIMYDVPHTFLQFPRLVVEYDYLWNKLTWLWQKQTNYSKFVGAFKSISFAFDGKQYKA